MDIADAAAWLGARVVYMGHVLELGVITGISPDGRYVFVRFDGDQGSKACLARDLEWPTSTEPERS